MDLRKLKKLIDLVQESGISELEVTEGEEKVRIAKHSTAAPATYYAQVPPAAAAPAPLAAPAPADVEDELPDGVRLQHLEPDQLSVVRQKDEAVFLRPHDVYCLAELCSVAGDRHLRAHEAVLRVTFVVGKAVQSRAVGAEDEPLPAPHPAAPHPPHPARKPPAGRRWSAGR